MQPLVMLRRIILAHCCTAIASIPCSVAALACPCSSWFLQPGFHDAPFARPLLELAVELAVRLYHIHPHIIRLDAAYCGLQLIHWIHATLGAIAVIPWNPKRQKNRSCLTPTWTKEELGKRSSIERFFGRVFLFFRLQRPPLSGWSTLARQVALTYTATIMSRQASCMTSDLEKESVMRTKRASGFRSVFFHRSTWAVSPVSLPTAVCCSSGITALYAAQTSVKQ
jgi:transposase